jgi:hypothetical protein
MKLVAHFGRTWILLLVAAAVVAGSAFGASQQSTGGPAHGKHTIQLREASAQPTLKVIDLDAPGLSVGDQVVTIDGLVHPDGALAGSMSQVCTVVEPGPNLFASTFACTGSLQLAQGELTVQGAFVPLADTSILAVTGGTGDFAAARGELVIATEADEITIALA